MNFGLKRLIHWVMKHRRFLISLVPLVITAAIIMITIRISWLLSEGKGNTHILVIAIISNVLLYIIDLNAPFDHERISVTVVLLISVMLMIIGFLLGYATNRTPADTATTLVEKGLLWGMALSGLHLLSSVFFGCLLKRK